MPINYKGAEFIDGPIPLTMDRFGLWSGSFVRKVRTADAYRHMPKPKSNHPTYAWLQLEKARMVPRGPWTEINMDFAGIPNNETEPVYQFTGNLSQEPIETKSNFEDILSAAGLTLDDVTDKERIFKGFPSSVKESDDPFVRALFGQDSYLLPNATWRKTYNTRKRPSDIQNYGTVDSPDGNPPSFADRNWMYFNLDFEERGKTYRVVKEWRLSGAGGINEIVYDNS